MYTQFVKLYDYIFPIQKNALNFLIKYLPKEKVLDIGCGTGSMASELANNGYFVTGMDINQEMINEANKKSNKGNPRFISKGMLEVEEEDFFDGAYCIGNTLVHLSSLDEVKLFLEKVKKAIKKNGIFLIQIINYDRIINQKITFLPTIKNEFVEMKRNYFLKENKVRFQTIIQVPNQDVITDEVELLALRQQELLSVVQKVGWNIVSITDGFNEKEMTEESYSFVLVLKREV